GAAEVRPRAGRHRFGPLSSMSIEQRVAEIAAGFDGEISLAAKDLRTGEAVYVHADRKCASASVIKLPILVHVVLAGEEGLLSLDEPLSLRDEDKVPGSGILTQLSAGLRITILDACVLMT